MLGPKEIKSWGYHSLLPKEAQDILTEAWADGSAAAIRDAIKHVRRVWPRYFKKVK